MMASSDVNDLTTIATFGSETEASIAQQCLAAAGIQSYLIDRAMVSTMWHLGVALGGVKLQVADLDAAEASDLISRARVGQLEFDSEDRWTQDPEENADDAEPELFEREKAADRALKVVILSILFEPLMLYAAWLLIGLSVSEEPLRQPHRRRAIVAGIICGCVLSIWLLLFLYIAETVHFF